MSVMGPRRCYCCGGEERTTGCVRGMRCGCSNADCEVCRFCIGCCNCTEQMRAEAEAARLQCREAMNQITFRNPNRINKRW